MKLISDKDGVVVILCHNKYEKHLPTVPSMEKLRNLIGNRKAFDVGYKSSEGFYQGKNNNDAIAKIIKIIKGEMEDRI